MKKIMGILCMFLLCAGCDVLSFGESPEKILEDSVKEMANLTSYTAESKTSMKADFFGNKMNYDSNQTIEMNRNKGVKMVITDKTNRTKMFLSEHAVATYENGNWVVDTFDSSQQDTENKWLIQQFLSLQDPKSTWNTLADSQVKKTVTKKGEESFNGIPCLVVEMKMEAKEFMKVYGKVLGSASGIKGSAGMFENIGNMLVENTTYTYWIGKEDKKIHRGVFLLEAGFGKYQQDVTYHKYNKEWNPSYPK